MLKMERAKVNNTETITITINKHFEAKELYYLKEYGIEDLTV